MRVRTGKMALVFLVVLAGGASLATAEFGLTGVVVDTGSSVLPEYSLGWEFTPTENIKVTKLGFWAPPSIAGFSYDHVITIYDSTSGGTMISGTVVAGSLAIVDENGEVIGSRRENDYAYVDVSAQNVVLNAGQTYVIASYWYQSSTNWFDMDIQYTSVFSAGSGITLGQVDLATGGQAKPVDMGNTTNTFLSANFQFEPVPTTIPVLIDVKPGSFPNSVNINGNGVIPVAILGSEDFDVSCVDPETLIFAGLEVNVVGRNKLQVAIQDVAGPDNGPPDGYADLVVHFADDTALWEIGEDSNAVLKGSLFDGTAIEGVDSVRVVSE
jgi:hypothetical protein